LTTALEEPPLWQKLGGKQDFLTRHRFGLAQTVELRHWPAVELGLATRVDVAIRCALGCACKPNVDSAPSVEPALAAECKLRAVATGRFEDIPRDDVEGEIRFIPG
jgi:hypothetical protein